ncbi:hypothetical protein DP939_12680 [Spongiactinospora rosea]|uniref:Uncharacterized protein n=1 Tax=Spongiactinospora rosea TaxID=2248750 RepID=A0A366M035_9ACTN|nr:hypothetical protein [Spongiactinospora rosea]RBQ19598.1 hypothetical protein DP939_12680 [Spongiactinospora rosea]
MRALVRTVAASRAFRVAAATAAGALAGAGVFQLTRTSGLSLFLITGGIAGAVAALALGAYNRAARLTEVRLTVPQISEFTFVVNDDARQIAWKLFVETVTRVSTQPLREDEGVLREALTSLYGLFATTREILTGSRPSAVVPGRQSVEHLAITMLNRELRPFLAKWHPRLRRFEQAGEGRAEPEWPDAPACRTELQQVQSRIHEYAMNFARLAGVGAANEMIFSRPPER